MMLIGRLSLWRSPSSIHLGEEFGPGILLRGNWQENEKIITETHPCFVMIGWGDKDKWNNVTAKFFDGGKQVCE